MLQLQVIIWVETPADISPSQKQSGASSSRNNNSHCFDFPDWVKKYLVAAIFRAPTGQPDVDLFRAEGGWQLVKKCIRHSIFPSLLKKKKKIKNVWEFSSPQVKYINPFYFCTIFWLLLHVEKSWSYSAFLSNVKQVLTCFYSDLWNCSLIFVCI